ncbi:MAG: hypothetical protein KDE27_09615, partial [Planctomycetes bacterium]|nr:hypothetical protein [Planctomycetota bacterium]
AAGKLQHEFDDGTALDTARWDRDARTMVFVDPKARPTKERAVPAAELSVDDWTAFADQTAALTGKSAEVEARRDAFLALLLLQRHAAAAASYLAALQPADDNSGTGDAGYPLTLDAFAILLRRLPDAGEPWLLALRRELQAGERLVGGLRALSERRNIAAAGHLEQLLTEHAHSYLVLALP